MAQYRKKPVVVEAWRVAQLHHDAGESWRSLPKPVVDAYEAGNVLFLNHPRRIEIKTLEGWMVGSEGDLIICGVKGELYPCKPDIFAATYELVEGELHEPASHRS